jgi:phage shock protein A
MALQLGALNQALRKAGVDDDLARQAAEEVAGYEQRFLDLRTHMDQRFAEVDQRFAQVDQRFAQVDQRFAQVDQRFTELRAYVDQRFTAIDGRLNLLSWMLGSFGTVILGFVVAVFVKLFVH